jgi:acyl-CoA synthetase (AMP-forming)/AMP-acid ligase II
VTWRLLSGYANETSSKTVFLGRLELMRETHKQHLLEASSFDSIVHLLQWRACHQPERLAYTFLSSEKEFDEHSLTYAALDTRARAIAARLQSLTQPGTRVLLLYPPGLEYIAAFFGCLYAGVVAVPAYPPQSKRFVSRLQTIVTDAHATIALTTPKYLSSRKGLHLSDVGGLESLQWISTSDITAEMKEQWRDPGVTSETPAFLQYTSGSTATPGGVMLSHGNLLHNLAMICRGFEQTPDSRGVIWLPPYPQDIEFSVERSHSALLSAGCAACSVEVAGEERLAVIQEVGRHH